MSNAVMPLSDYKNACDKIRKKTDSTDVIKSGELADKVSEVYEKGKQAEYDMFWDSYQKNGARTSYNSGFRGKGWNTTTYKPKYPILSTDCECLFSSITGLSDTLVPIDTTANMNYAFNWATGFVTIRELTVTANVSYTNCFDGVDKLVNITFKGEIGRSISFSYCTKLSLESAISVITHLKDYSADTTNAYKYKITFSSSTKALLDAEGNASPIGTTWYEYIDSLGWNA